MCTNAKKKKNTSIHFYDILSNKTTIRCTEIILCVSSYFIIALVRGSHFVILFKEIFLFWYFRKMNKFH